MNDSVLFGQVLDIAVEKLRPFLQKLGYDILLVRDFRGQIRILLPGARQGFDSATLDAVAAVLKGALGVYAYSEKNLMLFSEDLLDGERLLQSEDRIPLLDEAGHRLWLLDRQITGQDWTRTTLKRETKNKRVTFFGIKGGVGRSTALIVWSWHLAKQGQDVLVFDLDLESPGVSSTLLPPAYLPDYGIVDWFVEEAMGQAELIETSMVADSPLSKDLPGRIRVVSAFGSKTGDYLPKLARCYLEGDISGSTSWAERLHRMVEALERKMQPDMVILDSRAGLHDIAAVAVTRMDADTFLFAIDSEQTWNAYTFLFRHWKQHPKLSEFRQRLQIVAGMMPETNRDEYFRSFTERSWELFREQLYDEASAENPEAFSFDRGSEEAPHYPLPILWNRGLQEFDPCAKLPLGIDEQIADAAMRKFLTEADGMLRISEEDA